MEDQKVNVQFLNLYLSSVFLNSLLAALTSAGSAAIWLFYHPTLPQRLFPVL
jgi:hypothetical protein